METTPARRPPSRWQLVHRKVVGVLWGRLSGVCATIAMPRRIGASIRRGMAIVAHTPDSLPHNTPTTLRCTSCHLDGGRRAGVVSMLGSYARYPRFVVRENRTASIEDRVNFCLTRSLAGQPLPADSRDMRDMVRYLAYLSTGVKKGDWVRGEGLPNPLPPMAADTARGARVFAANCTRCHGV